MLVGGQDVGQVRAIQDVFEGRENANPDMRTILVVDEAALKISDSPVYRRRNWFERQSKPSFCGTTYRLQKK